MANIDWSRMFGSLFDFIDSMGNSAVTNLYAALSTTLAPVFWATAILWIAYWGFELLTMKAGLTPGAFIIRVIKLLAIYTFAFNWTTYEAWVVTGFNALPGVISGAVCKMSQSADCSGTGSSIGASLDQIWYATRNTSSQYMTNASWYALGTQLQGILILIVGAIVLAIAGALIALTKITLFLLLALAPIFVSMALFNFTSGLFTGWMSSLFTIGLVLPALVYGILGILIGIMQDTLNTMQQAGKDANVVSFDTTGPFIVMGFLTVFLLLRSEAMAHAIAGGPRMGVGDTVGRGSNVLGEGQPVKSAQVSVAFETLSPAASAAMVAALGQASRLAADNPMIPSSRAASRMREPTDPRTRNVPKKVRNTKPARASLQSRSPLLL